MLTAATFLPLLGAIFLALRRKTDPERARWLATAVAAVPLLLLALAWVRFEPGGGIQLVEGGEWIPSLGAGFRLGVDGISLPVAGLTALLFVAATAYPVDTKGRASEYYAWVLFLETASLGVFLALDLLLFYVFWDLTLVGMYFLIGVWGHEGSERAALKFFLYTLLGSLALLLGILGLYLGTDPRTFDMAEIMRQRPLAGAGLRGSLVFAALGLGFAIKTPLAPFHTWLPPAHVDAPAPASTILAGVMLKMGTYGFVRIALSMIPEAFRAWAPVLTVLAVVSILWGALVALAQDHLKRLIAYTSVNHMGYAVLGIAAAGSLAAGEEAARSLALTGAVTEMVGHGLVTGSLFLLAGSLWRRADTFEMDAFGGLASETPRLTAAATLAAFAGLGLPGLVLFVAEFQVFAGALAVVPVAAGIGLLGIVLTAALFLLMLRRVFLGELRDRWRGLADLGGVETAVLGGLLVLVVLLGVWPAPLLDVIHPAAERIVETTAP